MSDMVEGGASLAWRLLATLEGGSLLLATSALLAYSARRRVAKLKRKRRPVRSVLLTNTSNLLGKELKARLESRGCVVHTIPNIETLTSTREANGVALSGASDATDVPTSGASDATNLANAVSGLRDAASEPIIKVDALVIVGAYSPPDQGNLQGMAKLVSEDVYSNLKLLESLSSVVCRGGSLAWACAGACAEANADTETGAWNDTGDAFDTVLLANLRHAAKMSGCEPVWVGRGRDAAQAAEKLVAALLSTEDPLAARFTVRNVAQKAGEYVGRWLKIIT